MLDEAAIRFVEHADGEGLRLAVDDAVGYAETLPADDPMRVRFEETLAGLGAKQGANAPQLADDPCDRADDPSGSAGMKAPPATRGQWSSG